MSPSPIPLAPGSPRGSRPATEARARRVRAGCPRPPSLSLRGLRGARAPLRKPEPEGFEPGVPVPHPSRSGVSAGLAPRYGSPSQKGSSRVSPSPIPLAPGSPRGSRPATEARARRVRAGCPRPPSLSLRGLRGARAPLRKPEPEGFEPGVPVPHPSRSGVSAGLTPRSGVSAGLAPRYGSPSGDASRLNRPASRGSSLRFARNTLGPPHEESKRHLPSP